MESEPREPNKHPFCMFYLQALAKSRPSKNWRLLFFRLEKLLKCGCHSFCWRMGLDGLSGFLITPSPSASTSQSLASKKPTGQKCCMSCLDLENMCIYGIT